MSLCDQILDRLEEALSGDLEGDLAAHVSTCPACQDVLTRAGSAWGNGTLSRFTAPQGLVERLKSLPRLPLACERAQESIADALDAELTFETRTELVEHIHGCAACRASWEAFATLREVGNATVVQGRLRAALALHPKNSLVARRRRRVFDLRLATAAAYLLAALSVAAAGDPGAIARVGTSRMERASFYAKAAVENRLESYAETAKENVIAVAGWAKNVFDDGRTLARKMFGGGDENPADSDDVVGSENGGS